MGGLFEKVGALFDESIDPKVKRLVKAAQDPKVRKLVKKRVRKAIRQVHRTFVDAPYHIKGVGWGAAARPKIVYEKGSFDALQWKNSGDLAEIKLAASSGQKFRAHATRWEKRYCLPVGKKFTPIVDSQRTVILWLVKASSTVFHVRLSGSWLKKRKNTLEISRKDALLDVDTFLDWIDWLSWPPAGPRKLKYKEVGWWQKFEGARDYWERVPGWLHAAPNEKGIIIECRPRKSRKSDRDSAKHLPFSDDRTRGLVAICDIEGRVLHFLDTYTTSYGTAQSVGLGPIEYVLGARALMKGLWGLLRWRLSKQGFKTMSRKVADDTVDDAVNAAGKDAGRATGAKAAGQGAGTAAGKEAAKTPVYRHTLNKGGLDDILENQRLKSTQAGQAAGGGEGVRAYVGPVQQPYKGQSVTVEFTTAQKPTPRRFFGEKGAVWSVPEGEYLPIKVLRIFYPDGTVKTF